MPINAQCPGCGATYTVADRFAGLKGRCKKCQALFVMPVKSEVEIVLDEAAADAVSVDADQAGGPATTTLAPARRKKKKKKRRDKRPELGTAWWWGGLGAAAGICALVLLSLAACGYRLTALWCGVSLLFAVPFNTIIFALSLLVSNYYGSGVQLTEFRILIPKALILVLMTSFVGLVPIAGFFFAIGVWFIGVMSFFELELVEAALVVAINFVLGFFAKWFLIGMWVNSLTLPSLTPTEKPPHAPSAPVSGRP
jgi:predicted Zn finger-like uncharacterized protein